jgi:hypothetical protein
MFERDISDEVVKEVVNSGKIIEIYSDDKPYPSFLILGYENNDIQKPIHIVFAKNNQDIIIITVYRPDKLKWENNYQTRIKNEMCNL